MTQSITPTLAEFASCPVAVPTDTAHITMLSALDWLAVGIAGRDEPVSKIMRDMALDEVGAPQASLFGSDQRMPARVAAWVNGAISHALDYDDTHFAHIGHPSVAVFPAVMALGEQRGDSLAAVLDAALIGMELSIRVGLWLGREHYQVGFHQTATAGAFGATAGAGRLLGLTPHQMQQALGLCATRAAGLKAQFGTMGKPYNAGLAASAGVEVAMLAVRGFVANPDAIEGAFGYGAIHHGADDADAALAGLGDDWLFDSVSHKFHACCHGLHAALEAARDLDLAAPELAELRVRTHPRWMSVCNQQAPDTGLGAKFSYKTVLAMLALGYDTARLDSYRDAICADPRLIDLRDRISVSEDDSLSETQAVLTVLNRNGQRSEAQHDLATPMDIASREDRVRSKASVLIGDDLSHQAWRLLTQGGMAADLAAMMR